MKNENNREIIQVSQLNYMVRELIEGSFLPMWIEGELSNLSAPSSGHLYFSLKDAHAQVRCAMFRNQNRHLTFQPTNGMHVLVRAQISLYEERGDYQLIVENLEEIGDGALRRAFDRLKQKLFQEGLFDNQRKRALPTLPKKIGVITSPTGAAIRDILIVLQRRFPLIPVIIYPTQVQGSNAKQQIVKAIETANHRKECDVLILARGGGSLEDLWCFNEESVARAINKSLIPIVTGIGHEIDVTIADFVADQRAPTPSAAAELVSPDQYQLISQFAKFQQQLLRSLQNQLTLLQNRLQWLTTRLRHPGQRIREQMQQIDHLEQRLQHAIKIAIHQYAAKLHHLIMQLRHYHPQQYLQTLQTHAIVLSQQLYFAMQKKLNTASEQLSQLARALHAISPLNTLQRGYAIVTTCKTHEILLHVSQVNVGDKVMVQLADGKLECCVTEIILP